MIATTAQLFTVLSLFSLASARPACKARNATTSATPSASGSDSTWTSSWNSTANTTTSSDYAGASASSSSSVTSTDIAAAAALAAAPSASGASAVASSSTEETTYVPSSTTSSAAAATSTASSGGSGDFTGTATYYAAGLGACGWTNSGSDYIVAMNAQQYSSSVCGKYITITDSSTGNTATAEVVDLCPGCAWGDLDMSTGLFSALHNGNMDAGIFEMTWEFV